MHKLVLAVGTVLFVGVRLHVLDDDFPNPDIAGIVYNAEVLLDGGLPYVDTIEPKPPGSFAMAALAIALLGRGLLGLQLAHALWLAAAAPAVWIVASDVARHHAPAVRTTCAAMAAGVYLTYAPMFSYNYSSWMMPAYAWAIAAATLGLRRNSIGWHVLAGAAAMLAYATIQRAVVLAVLLPVLWAWARRRDPSAAPLAAILRWMLGMVMGAALVTGVFAWPYLAVGRVDALLGALFPIDTALRYTASADVSLLTIATGASAQLLETFWFAIVLIAMGIVADRRAQRSADAPHADTWFVGSAVLVASIAGAAIGGGRFYLHYLVQYVPGIAILAAHPALVALLDKRNVPARTGVALAVAAQLVEVGVGQGHRYGAMARRLQGGSTAAQAAGAHIRERTDKTASIMCWGWTAWLVYYWAERRAPGRLYKPLGTLTTFNTNTEFTVGAKVELVSGEALESFLEEFDAHPPEFFVYSPSMETTFGARPDPLQTFLPLTERINRDYVPDAVYGDLRLFRRRELRP